MYKLIALDIDGTLLNSEKKITSEVFTVCILDCFFDIINGITERALGRTQYD